MPPPLLNIVRPVVGLALLFAVSCTVKSSPTDPGGDPVPTSIQLDVSSVAFSAVGDSVRVNATVLDQNGDPVTGAPIAWNSSDPSVIRVDGGLLTATGNGEATITVTSGSVTLTFTVTVSQTATNISLDPDTLTFESLGDTLSVMAAVSDANAFPVPGSAVTWASSDEAVATVVDGTVTAIGNGTATVSASVGTVTATATVVVEQIAASVTLSQDSVTFASVSDTLSLTAVVQDAGGTTVSGASVTWASSDETVATVVDGLITAVGAGTATISGSVGSVTATAAVVVEQDVASVQLSQDSLRLVSISDTLTLAAEVLDTGGTPVSGASVTWASSDVGVATVDGGLVTAVGNGTATITASSGAASASAVVSVLQSASGSNSVVSVAADTLFATRSATSDVTVQLVDALGTPLTQSAGTVEFEAPSVGSVSTPVDNADGTYSAIYTAGPQVGPVTLTASLNGTALSNSAEIILKPTFVLADNGITIVCSEAAVGETGDVAGTTYTRHDRASLDSLVSAGIVSANYSALGSACTSGVSAMDSLFASAASFNEPINSWDVSSVSDMSAMFSAATSFNQELSAWDVSAVTSVHAMFEFAAAFNQPIGSWNVGSATDMSHMFRGATSFNQALADWDVSNVENMRWMFTEASAFDQPIGNWTVGSVTDMNYMFGFASAFNQDIGAWDVQQVSDMYAMFINAAQFDQPIGSWDVGRATNMAYMFYGAAAFDRPLGLWDVQQVTNMAGMFESASQFNQDLSGWCVGLLSTTPTAFDTNATSWALADSRPLWGSCPITLGTSYLGSGNVGAFYSTSITPATSAGGTVSYAVTDGSLPAGATLDSSTGLIAGTMTTAEASFFEITASNAWSSASELFSLTISGQPDTAFNLSLINVADTLPVTEVRTALDAAVARWEAIVTGDRGPVNLPPLASTVCSDNGDRISGQSIDDVLIFIDITAIDGTGGTLGSAGPCLNTGSAPNTLVGILRLDETDILPLSASDLQAVVWHEIGHIMGIGTQWTGNGLIAGDGTTTPTYLGSAANAEYVSLGGSGAIPIEADGGDGTAYSHWDDSTFDNEIMTGFLNSGSTNPISRMTIAGLQDLAWSVSYSTAESYSLPAPAFMLSQPPAPRAWEAAPDWSQVTISIENRE